MTDTPSLRRRLLGTLLLGALILSAVAFLVLELGMRHLQGRAREEALHAAVVEASRQTSALQPGAPSLGGLQWRLLGPSGGVIAFSSGFAGLPSQPWPRLGEEGQMDPDGRWFRAHLPLEPEDRGSIQLALDLQVQGRLIRGHTLLRLLMVAFTLLGAYAVGELMVRHAIRPLGLLAVQAALIRPKELGRRIPLENFPVELRDLVASMNIGMERLQEAFQRLEHLGTDLAHELRSPIQNLRSELEGLLLRPRDLKGQQETLGSCLEELDRLSQMIEQMLFLARCEEPSSELKLGPIPVKELLESISAYFEASADALDVHLEVQGSEDLAIMADRPLLQRALGNLVSNALRHTPAGGTVSLVARSGPKHEVLLEVRDTGEGIPPEMLGVLGTRFTRVEHSRSRSRGGTGLGLAIVKGIMHLHGASLELESQLGRGTTARLVFPPDPTGRTRRRSSGAHAVKR